MKSIKKQVPKLTNKQLEYTKNRINGDSQIESAKKAYPSATYGGAAKISDQNEKNPKIQTYMEISLAKKNLTPDTIAQKIAEGLDSNKTFFDVEASALIQTTIPDMTTRHKYLTTLINLLGVNAPTKSEHKVTGILGIDTLNEIQNRLGFK